MEHWYCARTEFEQETVADRALLEAGFEVFNPSIWKPATLARRYSNGSLRAALPDRIVPMFGRYVMFRALYLGSALTRVRCLPGIDTVLGCSQSAPSVVPDQAITWIRSLPGFAANGCLYPANYELEDTGPVMIITKGDRFRMLRGPLEDCTGICQWSDRDRVRLLFSLLGRDFGLTVTRSAVEAL